MSGVTPAPEVMEVLPNLLPLVDLANTPGWQPMKGKSFECDLASLESPALPAKAFRISLEIPASLAAVVHVITEQRFIREYDPTMDRCDVLEARRDGVLLYTSYKQQTWLVAPRDFCVVSANVTIDPVMARRLGVLPESALALSGPESLVYVQNNVSCTCSRCPPSDSGTGFVRGQIHVFGYIIYEGSRSPPCVHVDNYCCVEPGGALPNWVANAAIGQNCEKLQRIHALAVALQRASPQGPAGSADSDRGPMAGAESGSFPPPLGVADTQVYRPPSMQHNGHGGPPSSQEFDGEADEADRAPCAREPHTPCSPHSNHGMGIGSSSKSFHTPNSAFLGVEDEEEKEAGEGAVGGSGGSGTLSRVTSEKEGKVSSPPQHLGEEAARQVALSAASALSPPRARGTRGEATPSVFLSNDADAVRMAERIGALTRAVGWVAAQEEDSCVVERLCPLPASVLVGSSPSLRREISKRNTQALRVSTILPCSLDTVQDVLRSDALAADIDMELLRIGPWRPRRAGGATALSPAASSSPSPPSLLQPWQLRHYAYDRAKKGCPAWDAVLRCTDVEVAQAGGAALGLHTAGVRAGSFIWGGLDASEEILLDPHKVHRRATVLVFGFAAVAIPVTATSLRVSHFAVMDVLPRPLDGEAAVVSGFTPKESKALTEQVMKSMLARVRRLRALVSETEHRPFLTAMGRSGGPTLSLDGTPLLAFLAHVDRAHSPTAGERSTPQSIEVDLRDGSGGHLLLCRDGDTLSLHVTMEFPCSREQVSEYMLCARTDMRTLDERVSRYVLLPHGAPHTGGVGVSMFQLQFSHESRLRPSMEYTMLEAAGPQPDGVFALARVNCHVPQETVPDSGGNGYTQGNVYYDGFVVRSHDDGSEGAAATGVTVARHMCVDLPAAVSAELCEPFAFENAAMARDACRRSAALTELVASLRTLRERVVPPSGGRNPRAVMDL